MGYICWFFLRLWLWGIYHGSTMNCVTCGGERLSGGWLSLRAFSMHNKSGQRRAINVWCILPMYCAYWKFSVCLICVPVILGSFQKWLDK